MNQEQQNVIDALTDEQRSTGYAFAVSKERIVVEFEGARDEGVVMSRITCAGESDATYVVCFEQLGRMLVGVARGGEFDADVCPNRDGWYVNPCGVQNIEDAGLDVSIFNTHYEGGLFEIVEQRRVEGKVSVTLRRVGKTTMIE